MSTRRDTTEEMEENVLPVQAGDLLRIKREQLGMSQADVADRLRLRVNIIKSIDENNYEFDQVATFTRGYLRSYAKAVSLNEKEVLAAFDGVNSSVPNLDHNMQSFSRKTNREKHDSRLMKVTWIIVIALIGISSIWYYQNQQNSPFLTAEPTQGSEPSLSQETDQALSVTIDEPASPDRSQFTQIPPVSEESQQVQPELTQSDEAAQSDTQIPQAQAEDSESPQQNSASDSVSGTISATTETGADSLPVVQPQLSVQQQSSVEQTAVEQAPTEPANRNEIVMNFASDCWVQVKDANGKVLTSRVRKAGTTLRLTGKPPYRVILGAPEGVSMTYENEAVDLSGYNSGRVARFTLP